MVPKYCSHKAREGRCLVADCSFYDARDPLQKCFSSEPNAAFAQQLFRSDEAAYALLRDEAVAKHMIGPNLRQKRAAAMQGE